MAVNIDATALYDSALKELNNIIETFNKDKRTDKHWRDNVSNSVGVVKNTLETFKNEFLILQNTPHEEVTKASYSQIVHGISTSTNIEVRETKSVVLVTPKNAEEVKDSEQTIRLIQSETSAKALSIGVNRVKKVRNKGVIIELRNEEECKSFVQHLQSRSQTLNAKIPSKRNPQIMIHGIEVTFPEEDIVAAITEQNPLIKQSLLSSSEKVDIRTVRRSRHGRSKYAIVEVTPKVYQAICKCEKLYIGYTRCNFNDYIPVIRCFKCSGIGHVASDCNGELSCSICSESHEFQHCPQTKTECINCKKHNLKMSKRVNFSPTATDHPASSMNCPIYKRVVEIIKSKINYG